LLQRIHARGHEIGLHPSYRTYDDGAALESEFGTLMRTTDSLGIHQGAWGGRQHYLRWEAPTTWRLWAQAGLDYDASVGYADRVGFRCGTSHEFPVFDVVRGEPLALRERPLVLMEGTLLSRTRMDEPPDAATERFDRLVARCRRYQGRFSLLWHNNYFVQDRRYPAMYLEWLRRATDS
jgi:hypothetical protein